jgi:hypothetical protein
VILLLWYDYGSLADLLRFKHGYDRAGNRLYREEADTSDLDQLYSYDDVNRLVQSEEGTLSVGKDSISSLNFKQQWSLDATGNWSAFKEDLGGDATWDLQQTRTSRRLNQRHLQCRLCERREDFQRKQCADFGYWE